MVDPWQIVSITEPQPDEQSEYEYDGQSVKSKRKNSVRFAYYSEHDVHSVTVLYEQEPAENEYITISRSLSDDENVAEECFPTESTSDSPFVNSDDPVLSLNGEGS